MAIYNREDPRTALPQLEKQLNARIDGLLDFFYPVGCSFETTNTEFNPNKSWGGRWELVPFIEPVAWFQWNNGTLAHYNNFSSVTATATGVFTCVFASAMADADYLVSVSAESSGLGSELSGVYGKTTAQFTIDFCKYDGTTIKPVYVSVVVHGRLANTSKNRWHRVA